MKVVVLLAMRADELLAPGLGLGHLCRVDKMAAGALNSLKIGRPGLQPLGEDLGKHASAPAERADGVEPLKNGVTDKR